MLGDTLRNFVWEECGRSSLGWVVCGCALLFSSCGGRSAVAQLEESGDGDVSGDGDGDRPRLTECEDSGQCAVGERCQDGFCRPYCEPYEEQCVTNRAEFCDPETGWVLSEECGIGEICVEEGDVAYCHEEDAMQCPPGVTWCSSDNAVLTCTPEGRAVEILSCTDQGGVCSGGICIPSVCEPGAVYCQNDSIYVCSSDGTIATLIESCGPAGACLAAPEPHCENLACAPNSATCSGNVRLVCNELGTDYLAAVDCGTARCVEGRCRELICTPSELDCNEEGVVRCSEDGTSFLPVDPCTESEYCLEGVPTCQARVCVPNQPVCIENATAQCNSVGSGYLTGMDCGSLTCVGGTCRDGLLFHGNFEDDDLTGWMAAGGGYTYSVVNTTAGEGTHSVTLMGGSTSHYDGIFYSFAQPLTPLRVTYRARHDGFGSGTYFTLHDTSAQPGTENEVLFVYFRSDGNIAIGSAGGSEIVRAWQPQRWYEIAVDIDWQSREFDISVDGVLYLSNNPFRGGSSVNAIRLMSLYHYDSSVGYWDDIRFE